MVWFYKRDRASLSLETRYDNDTLEYVAIVFHPDGRRDTERFAQREAFAAWLQRTGLHTSWPTAGPTSRR
jgi:hypothetical protein